MITYVTFERYKEIFDTVKSRYEGIEDLDIVLVFKKSLFFTMKAVVKYNFLFSSNRKYFLFVNSHKRALLSQLDEADITAWFAHEIAHIIEYSRISNWQLLVFSLKYTFNFQFRFTVERRVSAYAANKGFANEMFGVWKKFLTLENVANSKYKKYIINNYHPRWEQIKDTAVNLGISEEEYESVK